MSRFIDASEKIIGNEKYLAPIEFSPLDVRLETIEISEKLQKRIFLIAKWEESTFIKMNDQIDESTEAYNFLLKRFKIAVYSDFYNMVLDLRKALYDRDHEKSSKICDDILNEIY